MSATHTLDGEPIICKRDGIGKTYYTNLKNIRVGTKGREDDILPISESEIPKDDIPKSEIPEAVRGQAPVATIPVDGLAEFPFLAVGVAMAAIMAGHGYHEQGGYCANRCGDRAAILSAPHKDGGNIRYRIEFPETMVLVAEDAE